MKQKGRYSCTVASYKQEEGSSDKEGQQVTLREEAGSKTFACAV